jgi:hypothetical protein
MSVKEEDSGMWDRFKWLRIGFILVIWLARYLEFGLHKGVKFLADMSSCQTQHQGRI